MEIKINKEIRLYRESIFFGLTLRQFVCAMIALAVAVTLYFGLKPLLGDETVSWVCIVSAAPIAAAGFFKYNGMTLEQFAWAVLKSELLLAGRRLYKSENFYLSAVRGGNKNYAKIS